MANNLNVNPAVFTTTQGSYKAAVAASQGSFSTLRVEKVYWFNPTATGNKALIIDPASGATLLCMIAAAGVSQIFDWTAAPKLWADFAVDQLDSGTLEIYFR